MLGDAVLARPLQGRKFSHLRGLGEVGAAAKCRQVQFAALECGDKDRNFVRPQSGITLALRKHDERGGKAAATQCVACSTLNLAGSASAISALKVAKPYRAQQASRRLSVQQRMVVRSSRRPARISPPATAAVRSPSRSTVRGPDLALGAFGQKDKVALLALARERGGGASARTHPS